MLPTQAVNIPGHSNQTVYGTKVAPDIAQLLTNSFATGFLPGLLIPNNAKKGFTCNMTISARSFAWFAKCLVHNVDNVIQLLPGFVKQG